MQRRNSTKCFKHLGSRCHFDSCYSSWVVFFGCLWPENLPKLPLEYPRQLYQKERTYVQGQMRLRITQVSSSKVRSTKFGPAGGLAWFMMSWTLGSLLCLISPCVLTAWAFSNFSSIYLTKYLLSPMQGTGRLTFPTTYSGMATCACQERQHSTVYRVAKSIRHNMTVMRRSYLVSSCNTPGPVSL